MPVMKLTQEGISKLRCPEGKRCIQYCDRDLPGLILEVRSTNPNRSTWWIRYRNNASATKYLRLGHYPDMSLDEARQRAKAEKARIQLGADPRAEENARKAVPTLTEFMEDQYFPHVATRKRTAAKDEEYYRLRLKTAFGNKRLNQIRRREVQLFHSALHAEGLAPATCNHYLKLLKRAFNLAIQWEIIEGPNVICSIQQYRELNLVEKYMDDEQLQRLLTVLNTDKNRSVCSIILFLLSTGARLNEALTAKWALIDVKRRVWRIPATNSKSGKVRAVPLNDAALEVLSKLDTKDEFEYVFINKQTRKPYTTIQKVWNRLRNAADLEHVRSHDLRHQHASMLVNSGRTLYEVQQILGHSTSKVTERYSHLSTATLQSASSCAADIIKEAMKKTA
ncbi:MAG: site-specific integrase [Pseudomonadota bacterium]